MRLCSVCKNSGQTKCTVYEVGTVNQKIEEVARLRTLEQNSCWNMYLDIYIPVLLEFEFPARVCMIPNGTNVVNTRLSFNFIVKQGETRPISGFFPPADLHHRPEIQCTAGGFFQPSSVNDIGSHVLDRHRGIRSRSFAEDFPEDDAKWPDVGFCTVRRAREDFRCCPPHDNFLAWTRLIIIVHDEPRPVKVG